jgi:hypothetical protein
LIPGFHGFATIPKWRPFIHALRMYDQVSRCFRRRLNRLQSIRPGNKPGKSVFNLLHHKFSELIPKASIQQANETRIKLKILSTINIFFNGLFANPVEFAEICPDVMHFVCICFVTYLDNLIAKHLFIQS